MNKLQSILSDRLIQARMQSNLTQEELALAVGCSQGAISKIERGDQQHSSLLIKIATVCKIDPVWLDCGVSALELLDHSNLSTKQIAMIQIMRKLNSNHQDLLIDIGNEFFK
jgi:transcriptional regulator with XRE-family HTH domain